MKLKDYMTVAQAAEETGVKYKTLLKRISVGSVKAERLGGKVFMIKRTEVAKIKKKQSGA